MGVATILVVIAMILFLLAATNWPQSPFGLGWLGMFFLALAALLGGWHVIL